MKLKQLQHESETWKRLLAFMMDENVHLKQRLSNVLKENFDESLLPEMENFQNLFIRSDEEFSILKKEVVAIENLLLRENFEDGRIKHNVDRSLRKFRLEIKENEEHFTKIKMMFNTYLLENLN